MSLEILEINDTLSAGESASVEYVPLAGKTVTVLHYYAEIPLSAEVVSSLSWDSAAVWNIRMSGKMPFVKDITPTDGVKKFELIVNNINSPSPQAMSARVELDVR